jgi:hypothetical protein
VRVAASLKIYSFQISPPQRLWRCKAEAVRNKTLWQPCPVGFPHFHWLEMDWDNFRHTYIWFLPALLPALQIILTLDGYSAPVSAGNFVVNVIDGLYNNK